MKIALFAGTIRPLPPPQYGSERVTWDLAVALGALGHEVTLIAPEGSVGAPGVTVLPCPQHYVHGSGNWYQQECAWAVSVAREMHADVVHDMSCSAGLHEAVCAAHKCRLPHLYTTNGISWAAPFRARHNVVVLSKRAQALAARGGHCWEGTRVKHPYRDPPLPSTRVVGYGVDLEFYAPQPHDPKLILYVGRPHEHKGTSLLPAIARLCPDLDFVAAWNTDGEPDHQIAEREFLAAAKGIGNLRFVELPAGPEHHTTKRDLLARAAVMLHPAVYIDAGPNVPIEAQASGVPVVAFDRGGVPEIIRNGVTGVLTKLPAEWPEWDARSIAAQRLAHAVRAALGLDRRAVRVHAEEHLGRDRMARDYLELYGALINGGKW